MDISCGFNCSYKFVFLSQRITIYTTTIQPMCLDAQDVPVICSLLLLTVTKNLSKCTLIKLWSVSFPHSVQRCWTIWVSRGWQLLVRLRPCVLTWTLRAWLMAASQMMETHSCMEPGLSTGTSIWTLKYMKHLVCFISLSVSHSYHFNSICSFTPGPSSWLLPNLRSAKRVASVQGKSCWAGHFSWLWLYS